MDAEAKLRALLDLAESVGITVRRVSVADDGDRSGGALVRLHGRAMLFIDPNAPVGDRLAVAAAALKGRSEIEDRFLPPELRRLIDEASAVGG